MYIYIITHPKFLGWVKIGKAKNPKQRLNGYQTRCPLREYKLEWFIKTEYSKFIEEYFSKYIKGNNYEWYNCLVDEAKKIIIEQLNIIESNINHIEICFKKKIKNRHLSSKYDYLTDGKIFTSTYELAKYIGKSQSFISNIIRKNNNLGLFINVEGYEVIRKLHNFSK